MLEQPPLEESEGNVQMYMGNGSLVAEMDAVALAAFHWSLWDMAANGVCGDEITIWATGSHSNAQNYISIGYCEIFLTGEGPVGTILYNPNAEFLHRLWLPICLNKHYRNQK